MADEISLDKLEAALAAELNRQAALRDEPQLVALLDVPALARAVAVAAGLRLADPDEGIEPEALDASNDG